MQKKPLKLEKKNDEAFKPYAKHSENVLTKKHDITPQRRQIVANRKVIPKGK